MDKIGSSRIEIGELYIFSTYLSAGDDRSHTYIYTYIYIYIYIYVAKSVNISHGSLGQGVVKVRLGARVTLSLSTWLHGELNKNLHKLSQIVQGRLIECGPIVDVMLSRVNFRASHHQQHGERGIKYTAACSVLLSSN